MLCYASQEQNGGEGLCVYLLDPSVPGWDRHFDGSGPLGFVGKKGAIVGVGIDCSGDFSNGKPGSIAIKRASDNTLLCEPVQPTVRAASKYKMHSFLLNGPNRSITTTMSRCLLIDLDGNTSESSETIFHFRSIFTLHLHSSSSLPAEGLGWQR